MLDTEIDKFLMGKQVHGSCQKLKKEKVMTYLDLIMKRDQFRLHNTTFKKLMFGDSVDYHRYINGGSLE
jgi:hypothetical protein